MTAQPGEHTGHVPVLVEQVLEYLHLAPGKTVIDATVGAGGHAEKIAERIGPEGLLIGIDCDPASLAAARDRITGCQTEWIHGNFCNLRRILAKHGIEKVDAVLADLGVSSMQLDQAARGFSFQHDGPLDMRMDPAAGESASSLVGRLPADELARIFWEYGEERFSRRIARRIVEERERTRLTTTRQLAEIVHRCVPAFQRGRRGSKQRGPRRIDPATRVFQALRIAVNDELAALEMLLDDMPDCVSSKGRAVVISFHSLEDRMVKRAFRDREIWDRLTKKPLQAGDDEVRRNPRARSAKLRAAERK